jgi:hypothetical protein
MVPLALLSLATAAPVSSSAENRTQTQPPSITSNHEINVADLARFTIERKFLPLEGGRILLRLFERPVIQVDPNTLECEILGWDIKLPSGLMGEYQYEMARKFLVLFSKADADQLTDKEKKVWLSILDRVDYTSYCIDRAAPHYLEGQLRRKSPDCYVDWSDGRPERINWAIANSLSEINVGETFGAWVKLGQENAALRIERVTLLLDA